MARNLITRTIKTTEATAMLVNTTSAEVFNETFRLTGTYKDNAAILKAITKSFVLPEDWKLVAIVDTAIIEQLYAISEADFLAHAHPVTKA